MNDICFEIENMHLALKDSLNAENQVKENLYALQEFTKKLKRELPSFTEHSRKAVGNIQAQIRQVQALIHTVDQKVADAQSRKQQELPPPKKPAVPANVTQEKLTAIASDYRSEERKVDAKNEEIRAQNDRIDEYIPRCHKAKEKLKAILSNLYHLEDSAKSETEQTVSAAQEALRRAQEAADQDSKINAAMQQFYSVFARVYETARKLYELEASSVRSVSYLDNQFQIRNNHSHISAADSVAFFPVGTVSTEAKSLRSAAADDELLIRSGDRTAFFTSAAGACRIKMPCANLHKLGGNRFTAEMESLGYRMVRQSDGTVIDTQGKIHWEKDYD